MQVKYVGNGFEVSADCTTTTEAFGFLGDCQEVLGYAKCGACGSGDIVPEHRVAKGYHFYSMKCRACHKKLRFGQKKEDGSLFPKLKSDDGEWLPNGGWIKEEFQAAAGTHNNQQRNTQRNAEPAPF